MPDTLRQLRRDLHRHPELSGQEQQTAYRIRQFVAAYQPAKVLSGLGGTGVAVVYEFSKEGPTIMIRCELDALPIEEANSFEYRSANPGVSHKCGHDGHMAIVAGLVPWLRAQSFTRGKVILLFQPAEETGEGALAVLRDPAFGDLRPDYVFALHNLPGEPLHTVITVPRAFSATVQSVAVYLAGKESHASEPEKGINPALAIAQIISALAPLSVPDVASESFALLTPVHLTMGTRAYGISAGAGELHYTLRTWSVEGMEALKQRLLNTVEQVCAGHRLHYRTEWFDYFPITINSERCNEIIHRSAAASGLPLQQRPQPFKFGEDFGWFSAQYPSALFGLGAGLDTPALHHAEYDFPDELIDTGIKMFGGIIKQILQEPQEAAG